MSQTRSRYHIDKGVIRLLLHQIQALISDYESKKISISKKPIWKTLRQHLGLFQEILNIETSEIWDLIQKKQSEFDKNQLCDWARINAAFDKINLCESKSESDTQNQIHLLQKFCNTYFEIYYELIACLYHFYEEAKPKIKNPSELLPIQIFLQNELQNQSEADLTLDQASDESLKNAMQKLWYASSFDSEKDQNWAKRWNVTNQIEDAEYWNYLVKKLKYCMDHEYYYRIPAELCNQFGISIKSDYVKADDRSLDQIQFGQFVSKKSDAALPPHAFEEFKKEIDLWSTKNIAILFTDYLSGFAETHSPTEVQEKWHKIKNTILPDLIHNFLNTIFAKLKINPIYNLHDILNKIEDNVKTILLNQSKKMEPGKILRQTKKTEEAKIPNQKEESAVTNLLVTPPQSLHPRLITKVQPKLKTSSFFQRHPIVKKSLIGFGIGLGVTIGLFGIGAALYFSGGLAGPFIAAGLKILGPSIFAIAAAPPLTGVVAGAAIGSTSCRKTNSIKIKPAADIESRSSRSSSAFLMEQLECDRDSLKNSHDDDECDIPMKVQASPEVVTTHHVSLNDSVSDQKIYKRKFS